MIKRGFVLSLLGVVLLLSGCAFDAQTLILSNPQIQDFLDKYPNADVSIIHFSAEEAAQELENFAEICGKSLSTPKELYKAEIIDAASGLRVIAYLDAANGKIECVKKYGQQGEAIDSPSGSQGSAVGQPAVETSPTGTSSPPASPVPSSASSSLCGNSVVEGTEECDDGNSDNIDGCTSSCTLLCVDSDGGDSLYKKGTAKGALSGHKEARLYSDQCDSSIRNRLIEYACGAFEATGKTIASGNRDCPYGCSDGACITPLGVAICGNGVLEASALEECDDGNEMFKDGCTTACKFKCWDTDSGDDKETKGEVKIIYQGQSKVFYDLCDTSTANRLIEYGCRDTSQTDYASWNRDCPFGCSEGECLTQEEAVCTDSDGSLLGMGENSYYYTKGQTKGLNYQGAYVNIEDRCQFGNKVEEGLCSDTGIAQYITVNCEFGCADGACKREADAEEADEGTTTQPTTSPTSCTDSDGGGSNDKFIKGTTEGVDGFNGGRKTATDYCHENGWLVESWCNTVNGNVQTGAVTCTYGCADGACLREAAPAGQTTPPASDSDNDGISDSADNCQTVSNAAQTNTDGDSMGDACDTDDDGDGISDSTDDCPLDARSNCGIEEPDEVSPPAEETGPTYTVDNPESCTDSDGGSNGLVKGTTKIVYTGGSTTYTDSCAGQSVKEHFCSANKHSTGTIYCAKLCVDGACVNS